MVAVVALVALVAVAALPPMLHDVQVPVRLVIVPDVGMPSIGVVNEGETSGANPAIEAPVGMVTVPVKVGEASGAPPRPLKVIAAAAPATSAPTE